MRLSVTNVPNPSGWCLLASCDNGGTDVEQESDKPMGGPALAIACQVATGGGVPVGVNIQPPGGTE
jgi:hypothetical protein